jgi:3'-phosphoadenosine 5'-phosphosulfate sulfotransferase (PAPS reductase)/FAD synthetase
MTGPADAPGLSTARFLELRERAETLGAALAGLSAEAVLARAIRHDFAGRIGLVSSFGTEAAVLLHMISRIDPGVPVIFLDTLQHFPLCATRSARTPSTAPCGGCWKSTPSTERHIRARRISFAFCAKRSGPIRRTKR